MQRRLTKGKKCKNCGNKFDQQRFGQVVCGYKCSIPYGKKLEEKRIAEREKQERKRIRKEKQELKTLSELKQDLEPLINEIARLIDKGYGCISCGGNGKMSGGHYWAKGGHDIIRFNLHNIWVQDFHCNNHKGGAPKEYINSIEKLYGKEYAEFLNTGMRLKYKDLHFDREMIKEAIVKARKIRNDLKKLDQTYSVENRIKLRDKYNKLIGIYS